MTDELVRIHDDFWNIRGSFKIAGLLDVGTQMSVVRLRSGGFALLDSYALSGAAREAVLKLTDGGSAVTAILNLHPFHTVHVKGVARAFPKAKLYGTQRHAALKPQLPWEDCHTEDPELATLFDDLDFSVPRGVDFIPQNQNLHFASVLAFHRSSQTLHVDDTLTWIGIPVVGGLRFHPSLSKVLQRRPGAADDFRAWANELIERCDGVRHLCTAHMRALPPMGASSVAGQVKEALKRVEKTLETHAKRYG